MQCAHETYQTAVEKKGSGNKVKKRMALKTSD